MFTITEAKIVELQSHRKELIVELEGWQDYQRHDLDPKTQVAVAVVIEKCVKQLEVITALIATMRAAIKRFAELAETDYPELPRIEVSQAIKDALTHDETGIKVANAHADVAPRATHMEITFTVTDQP